MENLTRLKRRLDKAADSTDEDGLLCDLLDEAEAFMKGYTRRRAVPESLPARGEWIEISGSRRGSGPR